MQSETSFDSRAGLIDWPAPPPRANVSVVCVFACARGCHRQRLLVNVSTIEELIEVELSYLRENKGAPIPSPLAHSQGGDVCLLSICLLVFRRHLLSPCAACGVDP